MLVSRGTLEPSIASTFCEEKLILPHFVAGISPPQLDELHPLSRLEVEERVRVGVLSKSIHPQELPDSLGMRISKNLQPEDYASKENPPGIGHNLVGSQLR